LQKYIIKHNTKNLFGGIVVLRNHEWIINDKTNYNWEKCERGDWKDWSKLKL